MTNDEELDKSSRDLGTIMVTIGSVMNVSSAFSTGLREKNPRL